MTEPRYTEAQIRAAFATRGEWWTDRHWPDFLAALAAQPAEPWMPAEFGDGLTDEELAEIVRTYSGGEYQVLTSRWVLALVAEVQRVRAAGEPPAEPTWWCPGCGDRAYGDACQCGVRLTVAESYSAHTKQRAAGGSGVPEPAVPAGFSANCLVINGVCIAEHDCGNDGPSAEGSEVGAPTPVCPRTDDVCDFPDCRCVQAGGRNE